jgi:hypothetical protein
MADPIPRRCASGDTAMSPMYAQRPKDTNPPMPIKVDGPSTTTHPSGSSDRYAASRSSKLGLGP